METTSTEDVNPFSSEQAAEKEKKRKAEMATKRRDQVMARMKKMQKNFIQENLPLFEETTTDLPSSGNHPNLADVIHVSKSTDVDQPMLLGLVWLR